MRPANPVDGSHFRVELVRRQALLDVLLEEPLLVSDIEILQMLFRKTLILSAA